MAAIGFVNFVQVALRVGQAVLPAYRSTCSQRRVQPPQLLAILCLMRDEDWTFRDATGRPAEHVAPRAALGRQRVPAYTTVSRCLRRLAEAALEQPLHAVVPPWARPPDDQATVAVDARALRQGRPAGSL